MTSLRWDNVPKPRVERPPLLAPSSKSARRKQKLPGLKDRIEGGRARTELHDLARSAPLARLAPTGNPGGVRRVRPEASRCGGFPAVWCAATAARPCLRAAIRTSARAGPPESCPKRGNRDRRDRRKGHRVGSASGRGRPKGRNAREMWADYHRSSRQAPASTQRTSPGSGKRTGPSRSSALSEERLARLRDLQRKLNAPEALTDAWR